MKQVDTADTLKKYYLIEREKEKLHLALKTSPDNRTKEQHNLILENKYNGNIRMYLLSMGKFKEIPVC